MPELRLLHRRRYRLVRITFASSYTSNPSVPFTYDTPHTLASPVPPLSTVAQNQMPRGNGHRHRCADHDNHARPHLRQSWHSSLYKSRRYFRRLAFKLFCLPAHAAQPRCPKCPDRRDSQYGRRLLIRGHDYVHAGGNDRDGLSLSDAPHNRWHCGSDSGQEGMLRVLQALFWLLSMLPTAVELSLLLQGLPESVLHVMVLRAMLRRHVLVLLSLRVATR